jgi:23S rRNA pseudouridine1911/1915/1917 synthase
VVERFKTVTLVRLRLMTGRTHQIRVHMEYLGHPLLADELYGPVRTEHESASPPHTWITRQALHAQTLAFVHPGTRRNVEFQAPLPADMANCLESARAART